MKKNTSKKDVFTSNEVMSLLENMSDGIKLVSEQHSGIVGRFDGIDGRLDSIDGRLDSIDGRLDSIDGRLDKLQDDVTEIKHKLSQKVDLEDFQKLEKRLIKVEKLVLSRGLT